jgi:hypothetical protein
MHFIYVGWSEESVMSRSGEKSPENGFPLSEAIA